MGPLDQLAWIRAVGADPRLKASALRIAMVMSQWIGKNTGACFPSVETIGKKAGMPVESAARMARRALGALQVAGWLRIRRSKGRSTNVYTLATRTGESGSTDDSTGTGESGMMSANPDKTARQPGQKATPTRTRRVRLTGEQGNKVRGASASAVASPVVEMADSPVFALKGGETWRIPVDLFAKLADVFPNGDTMAKLKRAALWCETHQAKRKTRKGMPGFLMSWFGRAEGWSSERSAAPSFLDDLPEPTAEALAVVARIDADAALAAQDGEP